jgi:high-affinity K+ transport system ATPase subunit B
MTKKIGPQCYDFLGFTILLSYSLFAGSTIENQYALFCELIFHAVVITVMITLLLRYVIIKKQIDSKITAYNFCVVSIIIVLFYFLK